MVIAPALLTFKLVRLERLPRAKAELPLLRFIVPLPPLDPLPASVATALVLVKLAVPPPESVTVNVPAALIAPEPTSVIAEDPLLVLDNITSPLLLATELPITIVPPPLAIKLIPVVAAPPKALVILIAVPVDCVLVNDTVSKVALVLFAVVVISPPAVIDKSLTLNVVPNDPIANAVFVFKFNVPKEVKLP